MKKTYLLLVMLVFSLTLKAQITPEMQKRIDEARARLKAIQSNPQIQAKLDQAQRKIDSLKSNQQFQKQMQVARQHLDSIKKTDPQLNNVQIPDMNSISTTVQIPDIEAMEEKVKGENDRLQGYFKIAEQSTPRQNLFNHAEGLPALTNNNIKAIAAEELSKAKSKLNAVSLATLNHMLSDSKINAAGTGVFILCTGGNKYAGLYLICSAIIRNPHDLWAANDLGVYYRDQFNYQRALQCYQYANTLDSAKSPVINTNIGWAATYYGDFTTGMKYFEKALALDKNINSANEGEAMIAYAKGDYSALLKCLGKEVKLWGGAGFADDGPSEAFSTSSTTAISKNNMQNALNNNSDPDSDHTFDNADPDGNGQDPPPGADVNAINYRNFKRIFVSDASGITTATGEYVLQLNQAKADLLARSNRVKQELSHLKPLTQQPYRDDEGNVIIPNRFGKFVGMMVPVRDLFARKLAWYKKNYEKKLEGFRTSVFYHDLDLVKPYYAALGACPEKPARSHDQCVYEVNCTWWPIFHKSKNNDLDDIAFMWNEYYNHVFQSIQWFINATAPLISRVHEEGWNTYLNDDRELLVRRAIVEAYGEWDLALSDIVTVVIPYCRAPKTQCQPVNLPLVNAPDPFSKRPKHIKEFEGPCYDQTYGFGIGVEETCHSSKFFVGGGPFKVFYQHMNDPIAAENNNYTHKFGADISVSKDIDIVKIDDKSLLKASAGVEGKIEAQFNDNWEFTGGSSSVGASADIGGLKLGGIEASRNVEVVDGQLNVSPLHVTTSGPLH